MKSAVRQVINALSGTGSSLGIHTFADSSPSNPRMPNFGPTTLDDAGTARALDYTNRLSEAWSSTSLRSNIASGFKSFLGEGYDVVVLVGDGQPYMADRTNPTSTSSRVS